MEPARESLRVPVWWILLPAGVLLVIAVGVVYAFALFKMKDFEASVGLAWIVGIVLSVHAYPQERALLLVAIPVLAAYSLPRVFLRAFLLTPVPYLGTFSGKPWNVMLPAGLVAFSTVAVLDSLQQSRAALPRHASGKAASPTGAEPQGEAWWQA